MKNGLKSPAKTGLVSCHSSHPIASSLPIQSSGVSEGLQGGGGFLGHEQ